MEGMRGGDGGRMNFMVHAIHPGSLPHQLFPSPRITLQLCPALPFPSLPWTNPPNQQPHFPQAAPSHLMRTDTPPPPSSSSPGRGAEAASPGSKGAAAPPTSAAGSGGAPARPHRTCSSWLTSTSVVFVGAMALGRLSTLST